ncbi:hypothetical protein M501DRAFT_924552 [Patellaria atrata CBS 101060]|uniref:GDS1 winged helix domain-containing protein n=1 Tax=Patellaria atrata CBS 101060 TaxID=1346257 RepID=A0A9P4VTN8_9PEZI|nr:hypothetical protein M501DRAFT_924552 [Patellaria atrata CBS 101060]
MPYNTRRKSLSLPSLGIQLPKDSSRSSSHRSPPSTTSNDQPPSKKVKRSHSLLSATSPSPKSPPKSSSIAIRNERPVSAGRVAEQTPPPSPGDAGGYKVDTRGIDDDIVVGVIEQLEKTGNRPHLVKELAAVLSNTVPIVQSSANPAAIISNRLSIYLRRPWSALARCPLGKELIGTHPKRMYFYLTNCPRQDFPEPPTTPAAASRIISPSLSSAADDDEEAFSDARERAQLSPSPEVDLSSPELEDESTSDQFSRHGSISRDGTHPPSSNNHSHNRRAVSPPLERDEREFTQTASSLQQRRKSRELENKASMDGNRTPEITMDGPPLETTEETEERAAQRNREAAAALFGSDHLSVSAMRGVSSSPLIKPTPAPQPKKELLLQEGWGWSDLKNPENIELDELDDLLGDCL